jgi:hypothetical protein
MIDSTIDAAIIARHPIQPPSGPTSQFPIRMTCEYPMLSRSSARPKEGDVVHAGVVSRRDTPAVRPAPLESVRVTVRRYFSRHGR